jgi:uncharacterized protein YlxW (UPF0749 family)
MPTINLFFNYFQELQKQREDEIDSFKTEYNNLLAKIDNLELDVKKITASMKQMDEQMSTQTQQNIDKEESYKVNSLFITVAMGPIFNYHTIKALS